MVKCNFLLHKIPVLKIEIVNFPILNLEAITPTRFLYLGFVVRFNLTYSITLEVALYLKDK